MRRVKHPSGSPGRRRRSRHTLQWGFPRTRGGYTRAVLRRCRCNGAGARIRLSGMLPMSTYLVACIAEHIGLITGSRVGDPVGVGMVPGRKDRGGVASPILPLAATQRVPCRWDMVGADPGVRRATSIGRATDAEDLAETVPHYRMGEWAEFIVEGDNHHVPVSDTKGSSESGGPLRRVACHRNAHFRVGRVTSVPVGGGF
jgi:hypothetical protein